MIIKFTYNSSYIQEKYSNKTPLNIIGKIWVIADYNEVIQLLQYKEKTMTKCQ